MASTLCALSASSFSCGTPGIEPGGKRRAAARPLSPPQPELVRKCSRTICRQSVPGTRSRQRTSRPVHGRARAHNHRMQANPATHGRVLPVLRHRRPNSTIAAVHGRSAALPPASLRVPVPLAQGRHLLPPLVQPPTRIAPALSSGQAVEREPGPDLVRVAVPVMRRARWRRPTARAGGPPPVAGSESAPHEALSAPSGHDEPVIAPDVDRGGWDGY